MSDSLQSILDDHRDAVVGDLTTVIDSEVAAQQGISGAAIRAAYVAVQKVKPGVVTSACTEMLPDFLSALAPFWDSCPAGVPFADHLSTNGDAVSEALLTVTDDQSSSARPTFVKAYNSLRGRAQAPVRAALPQVGAVIEKYATTRRPR